MNKTQPPTLHRGTVVDIGTGQSADDHHNAVSKAVDWLTERHRKGMRNAFDGWVRAAAPEGADMRADSMLDDDSAQALMINATEWLLARGEILAKGAVRNINAYLLGRDGPWFSAGQQRWIAQLAAQPLRLWRVTEVHRGQGMTLVDAVDASAPPVRVQERAGSQTAEVGLLLGARLMTAGDHLELSGAIYPIARPRESEVLDAVGQALATPGLQPDQQRDAIEWCIARGWLVQYFDPPPLPTLVDTATGEPILLVTDHYRVLDATALTLFMVGQADVEGSLQDGWQRLMDTDDDSARVLLSINPGKSPDRIEVFARTQALADEGRTWFESLARNSVAYLTREITDPRSAAALQGAASGRSQGLDMSPAETTVLFQRFVQKHYAKWADETIPILGNKTPRQSITTAAGLERVKGLIREYEDGDARMAQSDGRDPVSYQFLWDALGITR